MLLDFVFKNIKQFLENVFFENNKKYLEKYLYCICENKYLVVMHLCVFVVFIFFFDNGTFSI